MELPQDLNQSNQNIMNDINQQQPYQPQVDQDNNQDQNEVRENQIIPMQNYTAQIYLQLLRITILYGLLTIYSVTQIILTIVEQVEHNISTPIQEFYLMAVVMQFSYHTYYCSKQMLYTKEKMNQTNDNNECPIDLQLFIIQQVIEQSQIRFYGLWEFVSNRELRLSTLNNILYFWMFTLGNLVFVSKNNNLDSWYLCQLLFPGWIVALVTSILFALICLAFPIILCYSGLLLRHVRRRRQEMMQLAIPPPMRYDALQNPSGQPCYICLSDYEPADIVIQLNCHPNHVVHEECLRPWLVSNTVCPICRKEIQ